LTNSAIFFSLTKARLALSVVFSSVAGYLLAVDQIVTIDLLYLVLGGYCIVGASNSFNQIIEKIVSILRQ
jgi:protoheme IX farnesyltransferase